jgi:3-ketosteroid 9alpha-monooxygenase subunit A
VPTSATPDRFPGYPRGWFVVAFEEEIPTSAVRSLSYFGRELVAYRDEAGAVVVVDAFCPHLGAHLGVGGTVVDGRLRCPFHGWEFGADGVCTRVPYALHVPDGARLRAYPVRGRNGMIFVHYDPDDRAPEYEVPVMPEYGAPGFTPWSHERLTIATHPREIVENVVDVAHFGPVHATETHDFENEFDGHRAVQRARGAGSAASGYEGERYEVEATYYGPGYQITRLESRGVEARLVNAHTMIDEETLHLRFGVMLRTLDDAPQRSERFLRAYVDDLRRGFLQDIAIWENKRFREAPLLCDGDGPIGKLRAWYAQFH